MEKNDTSYQRINDELIFNNKAMFVYEIGSLRIVDANLPALKKYGFSKHELLQKRMSDLGVRIHYDREFIGDEPIQTSVPKNLWRHRGKSGGEWVVQLTTQRFLHNGRSVELAVAHDVDSIVTSGPEAIEELPGIENNHLPFGVIEWNSSLEVIGFTEEAEKIFDQMHRSILQMPACSLWFVPDEFNERVTNILKSGDHEGEVYFTLQSEVKKSSGDDATCQWFNLVTFDDRNNLARIYSVIEEMTSQRKTLLDLGNTGLSFRIFNEQSFAGAYVISNRSFVYVNPRLTELTGYSLREFTDEIELLDLISPDDVGLVNRQIKKWEKNPDGSFEFTLRIVTKQGKTLHIKTFGSAVETDADQILLGVVVDQTDHVKALEGYRSSLQSYQSLFDSITDSIYIQDKDGTFLEINKEVEKMYGYKKEEILGKTPAFLAAKEKVDLEDTMQRFRKALAGEPQYFRWWGRRKDGEVFPKDLKLSKGRFFGHDVVIAVARDCTEIVRREEELKRNEELFEQLFRNSPLGIALLDKDSKILQVNQGFESLFGYRQSEISGKDLDDLIVPDDDLSQARRLSESTEPFTFTKKRRTKSGELLDVIIYGVPVIVEGETIAIYGLYMDITDRIDAEEKVKKSLEEKEVLLSEIHHRVKNNLAVISGLLELQFHNLESAEAKSALRDSQMRVSSMALIHEKLYQNENLSEIDFGAYMKELVDVIVDSHGNEQRSVRIELESDPVKLPIAKAIPCGLILNEIVTNSLKYAFPESHKDPVIGINLQHENGRAVMEISDNGVGLPKPFEEVGDGSLGTLLIKTLIGQLEAELTVDGESGTRYIFSFDLL